MSEFIDVQDIAIRNRIAVDGRVNPTVEDWNNLLTHIDRLEQENVKMKEQRDTWSKLFHSENKENNRLLQENAELKSVLTKVLSQAEHRAAARHIFERDEFEWAVNRLNKLNKE